MKEPEIAIRIVKKWPKEEIIALYKVGGWWSHAAESSHIKGIIAGSFAFAVALDNKDGKAVGMGRVMSDGISDAYIQDVIVLPAYRKQQVGRRIIEALRDHCLRKNINWIALVAESNTERFYRKIGFKTMRGHTPMRYMGD
jgi:aralkylamine N-acetyltransferase